MNIADRIAAKRHELALFVTDSASAVLAEDMSEQRRGAVALDLLRLMIASGLSAQPQRTIDVSPEKPKAAAKYVLKPSPSDEAIAAAMETEPTIQRAAKKLGCGIVPVMAFMKRGGIDGTPEVQDAAPVVEDTPLPTQELKPARTKGRQRRFTDEALFAAIEEFGHDNKAISERLGVIVQMVHKHRRRLGVPSPKGNRAPRGSFKKLQPKRFTDDKIAAALIAANGDQTIAAAALGCSNNTVYGYRRRTGLIDESGRGKRRSHTDAAIAAALEAAGGERVKATELLGCGRSTVDRYCKENGIFSTPANALWDEARIGRLREMAMQSPRPPKEDLASAFGVTVNAIQTAMSRYGITKRGAPRAGTGGRGPSDLSNFQKRDCITCTKPFTSEGKHNRMCGRCKSTQMEYAA